MFRWHGRKTRLARWHLFRPSAFHHDLIELLYKVCCLGVGMKQLAWEMIQARRMMIDWWRSTHRRKREQGAEIATYNNHCFDILFFLNFFLLSFSSCTCFECTFCHSPTKKSIKCTWLKCALCFKFYITIFKKFFFFWCFIFLALVSTMLIWVQPQNEWKSPCWSNSRVTVNKVGVLNQQ